MLKPWLDRSCTGLSHSSMKFSFSASSCTLKNRLAKSSYRSWNNWTPQTGVLPPSLSFLIVKTGEIFRNVFVVCVVVKKCLSFSSAAKVGCFENHEEHFHFHSSSVQTSFVPYTPFMLPLFYACYSCARISLCLTF